MLYRAKMDWLSLTWKLQRNEGDYVGDALPEILEYARNVFKNAGRFDAIIQTVPPSPHYVTSVIDTQTGARLNFGMDLTKQGIQLVLTGSACKTLDNVKVLANLRELYKAKVTRFDFAVDLFYSDIQILEVAAILTRGFAGKTEKSSSVISSKTGDTLYWGSRNSDKMLRFYDKGREQSVPVDWKRAEMEFKGHYAAAAFEVFCENSIALVPDMVEFLGAVWTPLHQKLREISTEKVALSSVNPRAVTDREAWLRGQVLASFTKLCTEEPDAAERVFGAFQEVYIATRFWKAIGMEFDKAARKDDNQDN